MSKGQRSQYVRDVNNANVGDVVAGTIWDVPGKGKSVGFSKKFWEDPKLLKEKLGVNRRGILAHEAFHANRPVLGRSEILAHAYGGAKDKKVRGIKDVGRASKRAAGQVAHLLKSRPGRFGFELGVLGAAATAGKMGYDRLTKPKEEVNKRNQMTAARALTAGAISNMYLPVIAGAARGEGFNSFDRLTTKRNLGTLAFTAGAALLNPEVRELYKKEKNA